MRVLDEVAEAIQSAGGSTLPVRSSFGLEEQLGGAVTPRQWAKLQRSLGCALPPLEFAQGRWLLPDGLATVWDLADHAADHHPDWERPAERTAAAWRNAQVFAGVRRIVAEACGVEPNEVTRESRFADLFH